MLNFQILDENEKINTDILVEQNRSIGFIDDFDKSILGYDLNNLMENYYAFVYLEGLLNVKSKKTYSFQVRSYPKNDSYNYLVVKPLTSVRGELYEFSIQQHFNRKRNDFRMDVPCWLCSCWSW